MRRRLGSLRGEALEEIGEVEGEAELLFTPVLVNAEAALLREDQRRAARGVTEWAWAVRLSLSNLYARGLKNVSARLRRAVFTAAREENFVDTGGGHVYSRVTAVRV